MKRLLFLFVFSVVSYWPVYAAPASDAQVQEFVNTRIRARAEQIRALRNAIADDKAAIDDVYEALTQQNPTWADNRTDAPPHLLTPADILSINAFYDAVLAEINADTNLPIVLKACVRSVQFAN